MVVKQKYKNFYSFVVVLLVSAFTLLATVSVVTLINTTSTSAINGCPGQELPGSGANSGKCVGPNGQPTANIPAGTPATDNATTPDQAQSDENPDDANEDVTCSIEKLGWLLCPVIETSGKIGDQAFQFLSTTFLETEPELVSNDETGTKYAWELSRNLANIMFIIAFLIIIYSQVTGAGINNYGIKKMMPRLIVAALAVNVSYYICQLMVDLSNVMGYEIQNFMVDTAKQISDRAAMPPAGSLLLGDSSPGVLEEIVVAILAGAAVVWMLLPFVFVGVGTIVITCIIILVILLLRKAFIVLLIVASPIAFVLYLLPNTEKYFQKWLSMFWKLLMVFPVVGILMGGGQLASAIILAAGSNGSGESSQYSTKTEDEKCIQLPTYGEGQSGSGGLGGWWSNSNLGNNTPATGTGNTDSVRVGPCDTNSSTPLLLGLVAAGIAVAPLLAVFSVLKGALNAAGAIGGKIAGAVDTYTRKGADWGSKNTSIGRGMAARQAIKQNYKDQRFAKRMSASGTRGALTRTAARGIVGNTGMLAGEAADKLGKLGKYGELAQRGINGATGSMQAQNTRLASNFAGAAEKIQAEEMQAAGLKTRDQDNKELHAIIDSGSVDDPTVGAAIKELIKRQDFEGIEKALDKFGNQKGLASRVMGSELDSTGLFTGGQVGNIARGAMSESGSSYSSMITKNLEDGLMSPDKIATSGPSVLAEASRLATSLQAKQSLVNSAHAAMNDDILKTKISRNRTAITNFQSGHAAHDTKGGTDNPW